MKKENRIRKTTVFITVLCMLLGTTISVHAQNWSLTGNSGIDGAVNFLGTIDNKAFKIRTNNTVRMMIANNGKIAIGNFTPIFKLDVKGGSINTDSMYRLSNYPALVSSLASGNTFVGITTNTANLGTQNTFVGSYSGLNNSSGGNNSFIGYSAGSGNTTGTDNTFIGQGAGSANSTGSYNTVIGKAAGYFGSSYSYNTFIGYGCGYLNTGSGNTFAGYRSGLNNTSGYINTYFGVYAGHANLTGTANVAVGDSALIVNTATGNSSLGSKAGLANTTGNWNVYVGEQAGYTNTTGSNNTFIGSFANANTSGLTNATSIGALSYVSTSNSMVLGEGVNVGIGNHAPAVKLNVTGTNEVLRLDGTTPYLQWKNGATLSGFIKANSTEFLIAANSAASGDLVLQANGSKALYVHSGGTVSIGTATAATGYKLSVGGNIICEQLRVELQANWPDYVFSKDHQLLPIPELEKQIEKEKHLPGIPSSCELEEQGGLNVGEMQIKMMEKIEELTLYVIQLKKENDSLKSSINSLKK